MRSNTDNMGTEYNDCPECGAKSEDYHRPFICENCETFFPELRYRD